MNSFIRKMWDLRDDQDSREVTMENVIKNISFRGANLWILMCAIIIASIGLNINSTAVIIGAMLISPLMWPITAIGFALGTHDISLFRRSLRNLLIATVASIFVSTVYFLLSPFKEIQSEILVRTAPNIYDILIAFFGGIVGVIAITRVEKWNPIPGVAIATALMPALCTAWYWLATGQLYFFLGALYLYGMNCVFICLATLLMVSLLKFPRKTQVSEEYTKRIKYFVYSAIILMIFPGIYFAYTLYQKQQFYNEANTFIAQEFSSKDATILFQKIHYSPRGNTIELAFFAKQMTTADIENMNKLLPQYGLRNTSLTIRQNNNLDILKTELLGEIRKSESTVLEKDMQIKQLETKMAENEFDEGVIFSEVQTIFPTITSFSLEKHTLLTPDNESINTVVLLYSSVPELLPEEQEKLKQFIMQRLSLKNLEVYVQTIKENITPEIQTQSDPLSE